MSIQGCPYISWLVRNRFCHSLQKNFCSVGIFLFIYFIKIFFFYLYSRNYFKTNELVNPENLILIKEKIVSNDVYLKVKNKKKC